MSNVFHDWLVIDGLRYQIAEAPLEPFIDTLSVHSPRRITPFSQRGYVATWVVYEDTLYLSKVSSNLHAMLFADTYSPVIATWFTGLLCARRGERRHTGYPPRSFWNEEIVLDIASGRVIRSWYLDLHSVPDQTSEELRLSVPSLLLKDTSGTS